MNYSFNSSTPTRGNFQDNAIKARKYMKLFRGAFNMENQIKEIAARFTYIASQMKAGEAFPENYIPGP